MMQTNISAEEFSRYQSQLLDLRQQKYEADEARVKAENIAKQIEDHLAQQSGELANIRSQLSGVQRAGDIDSVLRENHNLRQKLINIESSFQLQTTTLRAECEHLQNANQVLLSTLKVAGCVAPSEEYATVDVSIQMETCTTVATPCQTDPPRMKLAAQNQTDITSSDLLALHSRIESTVEIESELAKARHSLAEEKTRVVQQHDTFTTQIDAKDAEIQKAWEENEALLNDLAMFQRRSDKVQKELRRQLASTMHKTGSSSSLVFINSSLDSG